MTPFVKTFLCRIPRWVLEPTLPIMVYSHASHLKTSTGTASDMKTNKATLSRVRKTKNGLLLACGKGRGHFNAKQSRSKKMQQKRQRAITISHKEQQRLNLTS